MKNPKALPVLSTLVLLSLFVWGQAFAQSPPFTLKDGDRVVFLGSSIFENDLQYGYLEYALTRRFPTTDVTFRNLGWTGDNVWGEGRSTFTNPPTPYEHLMEDITKAQPTIVFVGYGGVESQDGPDGVDHFKEGLNKLLDKIEALGARAILLSTIPVASTDTIQRIPQRNANLVLYSNAISQVAKARNKQFIDIYQPILTISGLQDIIENTVHLNEKGYYFLAQILEKELGLLPDKTVIEKNVDKKNSGKGEILTFNHQRSILPLPFPESLKSTDESLLVKVTGLKKGAYTLSSNGNEVASGTYLNWQGGVQVAQGPSYEQAAAIRNMIVKKNELHFFQYRPLNQTYIVGFRRYEQGRHVKGLEEQNILIKWLEGQISLHKKPLEEKYRLWSIDKP